jgi:hypothetical protein
MKRTKNTLTADDILNAWKLGKEIDWRPLTVPEKYQWTSACMRHSGIPNRTIPAFNYIIEGNQVTHDVDFFCLLGEVFFGYKGYFGGGLDAFYDCFIEIGMREPTKVIVESGATVIIKHHKELAKVLEEDYYNDIVNTFQQYGFRVDLE